MPEVLSYPRPRANRIGGESSAAAVGYNFPRGRFISFNMSHAVAGSRQSMSLGSCQGPALIKGIRVKWSSAIDPPGYSLEVGYSRTAVLENTVSALVARPYQCLTEIGDGLNFLPQSAGEGLLHTTYNQDTSGAWELNLIVNEVQFFPVLSLWLRTGGGLTSIVGSINIIENIDPRALASFL